MVPYVIPKPCMAPISSVHPYQYTNTLIYIKNWQSNDNQSTANPAENQGCKVKLKRFNKLAIPIIQLTSWRIKLKIFQITTQGGWGILQRWSRSKTKTWSPEDDVNKGETRQLDSGNKKKWQENGISVLIGTRTWELQKRYDFDFLR